MYHVDMRGNSTRSGYKRKKLKKKTTAISYHEKHLNYNGLVAGCYNFGGYLTEEAEDNHQSLLHLYHHAHRHNDDLTSLIYYRMITNLYSIGLHFTDYLKSRASYRLNDYFQQELKKFSNWEVIEMGLIYYGNHLISLIEDKLKEVSRIMRDEIVEDYPLKNQLLEEIQSIAKEPFKHEGYTFRFDDNKYFVQFLIEKDDWNVVEQIN